VDATPAAYGTQIAMTVTNSSAARFFRLFQNVTTADGMVLISAATYTIGDTLNEISFAVPTNVYISGFFMDTNIVRYDQWQLVYTYAISQGYAFDSAGSGKATNHPAILINWYDALKWCNARSQQANLTPVYYTDAGGTLIYTNGDTDTVYPNWSANGYRLPTSAEWEKAARGGLSGQRFPWGLTISESQANYYGDLNNSYDFGPAGNNTNYDSTGYPFTSPVGTFAPNGFGLFDMAGNVEEWCWDWFATPPYPAGSPYLGGTDPRGPATPGTSDLRVTRGGSCFDDSSIARCAYPNGYPPSSATYGNGFRCVRKF
jgi:formylglycine-generating enzyme required for sulfatase activity